MSYTVALRIFRAARKRYLRCGYGEKRRAQDALVKARTALMDAENRRRGA